MCDCNTDAGWMETDFANGLYYHENSGIYKTNTTINCSGCITHMHAQVCLPHAQTHIDTQPKWYSLSFCCTRDIFV
jgi:hypothetical protein